MGTPSSTSASFASNAKLGILIFMVVVFGSISVAGFVIDNNYLQGLGNGMFIGGSIYQILAEWATIQASRDN